MTSPPFSVLTRVLAILLLSTPIAFSQQPPRTIVIGFVGGRVHADNAIHLEVRMAKELQKAHPTAFVKVFANHSGEDALREVLHQLDTDNDTRLTDEERKAARVIIYGHSWGASQTMTLSQQLNREHVPVLLAVMVDTIGKSSDASAAIPPNVAEAVNFYQDHGLLRGRTTIQAADPTRTQILGNFRSDYSVNKVDIHEFPWFARTFMRTHIEIENDAKVWDRIHALIEAKIDASTPSTTLAE